MAGNGLFVPSFTRWRERETEAQRGIGETYRKSAGQMSHEKDKTLIMRILGVKLEF